MVKLRLRVILLMDWLLKGTKKKTDAVDEQTKPQEVSGYLASRMAHFNRWARSSQF